VSNLRTEKLGRSYGGVAAVEGVDLDVSQGELVALLGPSGCGKTTTLRMIAGFVRPTRGSVLIGGKDVTKVPPYGRDTSMVFQGYALFPHMTVAENVAFGLEMRRVPRSERERRVADALQLVRLERFAGRLPHQLSGGQQQRVALARALVVSPAVFLLDEPLSNLDARLRQDVRLEIRELQQRLRLTTLLVTHDQEEALTMADRLVVMDSGRVRQIGRPADVYENPVDLFVASFLGRCTVLRGVVESPGLLRAGPHLVPCSGGVPGKRGILVVRPERVEIAPSDCARGSVNDHGLPGRITAVTYLGGQTDWHVATDAGPVIASRATPIGNDPLRGLAAGNRVVVNWQEQCGRLLADEQTSGGGI
jgi:putative spermidine/putrescine transport system ATP-binding protein